MNQKTTKTIMLIHNTRMGI